MLLYAMMQMLRQQKHHYFTLHRTVLRDLARISLRVGTHEFVALLIHPSYLHDEAARWS